MLSAELIRQIPFFSDLNPTQITTLFTTASETTVEAGHDFFHEDDELKSLYLLEEGRVGIIIEITDHSVEHKFSDQLTRHLKKKDITVDIIERGDFFGWSALIPPCQATAGARAITPCRVLAFSGTDLLNIFQEDSKLGYLMLQKVAQIARHRIHELHIESLASIDRGLNEIYRMESLHKEVSRCGGTKTIGQLLETKGYTIWSITSDTSVFDALHLLADKKIGALLVIDDGNLVGIFSERDYARNIILKGRSSMDTRVKEIMTRDVIYTDSERTIDNCLALMTAKHIRHLPVFANGQLVGIVSIGDLVKEIISEQTTVINHLEKYILENINNT